MYNDLPAGPAGAVPDVVGRRRERAVLPAQGRQAERAGLLVPRGRQGHGRQRPDGDPRRAARTRSSPTCSSTTCSTQERGLGNFAYIGYQPPQNSLDIGQGRRATASSRPTSRPRWSSRSTSTEGYRAARAAAAADAAWHQVWPGSRLAPDGRSPRSNAGASGGPQDRSRKASLRTWARGHWLWLLIALPGIVWLAAALPLAAVRRPDDRVRRGRPDLPHAAAGLEPGRVEHRGQFTDVFKHIVGPDGYFGPALLRTGSLRPQSPACCAC